ncbi:metalloregulator ArsR/SmtB family transcription factor [Amycolatopsis roodepoortensis]|uniref:ArsR/SmtB family transcription factor n=1 Tax=Amycolatopsis roodepoortensis TaxID=700274 RepID=UPI00214CCD7B|nr:metalloregulator ArsR/SmtB family transcription factor [Amycolatopsis roodepoortensis]UUV35861.1 metalloregulator ArsR/SmtB family transcription factor [Amycolatopsis roodepoortensis]
MAQGERTAVVTPSEAECAPIPSSGVPLCSVPLTTPRLPADEATQISVLFKALGHPHRVQLMNLLARQGTPVCVYDITIAMDLAQSTVSHHLKQLVSAGLLRREQRGIWAYYSVDRAATKHLSAVIDLDVAPQRNERDTAAARA